MRKTLPELMDDMQKAQEAVFDRGSMAEFIRRAEAYYLAASYEREKAAVMQNADR